jgi:hypothetical protein
MSFEDIVANLFWLHDKHEAPFIAFFIRFFYIPVYFIFPTDDRIWLHGFFLWYTFLFVVVAFCFVCTARGFRFVERKFIPNTLIVPCNVVNCGVFSIIYIHYLIPSFSHIFLDYFIAALFCLSFLFNFLKLGFCMTFKIPHDTI